MSLKDKINSDLKAALLSGDRLKSDVLRSIKAVILDEEVALHKREDGLEDSLIEQLIAKELKKRKESASIYIDAGREELAEKETSEAEILSEYLPKQLSEDEILITIKKIIDELGASDMSLMGQVIGSVKKQLGNAADGAVIARLVKETLGK